MLSALLLWLVQAAGVVQGMPAVQGVAGITQASTATRAADVPTQRSTPAVRHLRAAVLSERTADVDGLAGQGNGHDPAIVADLRLPVPATGAAVAATLPDGCPSGRFSAGFSARAPPILV